MLRVVALLLFVTSLTLACSAHGVDTPVATRYQLIIDETFVQDERETIARAGDAWATAIGPDLTISYAIATRVEIDRALEHNGPSTTFYAVRIGSMSDIGECLVPLQNFGCTRGQRFYLAADTLDATYSWSRAATHEVGHVFGLGHSANISVMRPELSEMSATPTTDDVYNWCRLHACPMRLHK